MKTIASATLQRNNETWVDLVFQDGSLGSCALENPLLQSWLLEGNTPLPAPEPEPAPVLTTEQKLEAAGLTVAELRELFNLPADESL